MADYIDRLTDEQLRSKLTEFGFPVVPITHTTRKVVVKKLKLFLENGNNTTSKKRSNRATTNFVTTETRTSNKSRIAKHTSPNSSSFCPGFNSEPEIVEIPYKTAFINKVSKPTETCTSNKSRITKYTSPHSSNICPGFNSEPETADIPDNIVFIDTVSRPKISYGISPTMFSNSQRKFPYYEIEETSSLQCTQPATSNYTKWHTYNEVDTAFFLNRSNPNINIKKMNLQTLAVKEDKKITGTTMADYMDGLTDDQLRIKLAEFGFPVMPITSTTRKVMAKKLKLLIENKNKTNSEGRRSLAKYSSEEESDTDVKVKKDKNRRATLAAPIMQPPSSKTRKSTKTIQKEEVVEVPSTTSVSTETRTSTRRRTTRLIKPQTEDFDTGSDSEPEIIEIPDENASGDKTSKTKTSYGISPTLSSKSRAKLSDDEANTLSLDYSKPSTTSYTKLHTSIRDTTSSLDHLNQIKSRLSMDNKYDRSFGVTGDRKIIGASGYGEGDSVETPFLSNFTRRLSQLSSSPAVKTDYNYENDIIKEHDSNGSSYNRLYLSRSKKRDFPSDFKTSQEKNIFKNNVVSVALLGIAIAFFIGIFIMYMGMKSENSPALMENTDYILPVCVEKEYQHKPGINCVSQQEMSDTINLFKALMPELLKRAIHYRCTDSSFMPYMSDQNIIDFVSRNYAPRSSYDIQKDINNLQVLIFKNPKWGISIIKTESFPNDIETMDNMDQILNSKEKNLGMVLLNPDIPWRCFILNKLYTFLSSAAIVGLGFSLIFGTQKLYKQYKHQCKVKNDQIYLMVEKIIDILQNSASDNGEDFVAVNHVRDMIIPPQERKQKASIWDAAVKFLEENESRVRTEVQIVSGEEFHVWRWLGSPTLNMSGSKVWQGQAFETQVGSVNSLPCSPTPCLKVRGFDERERNTFAMREAVLSKCASQCKILHCDVDPNSNCVYLKCANPNEAAIAYRNLHGWWYDGNLLTVKYLRLERYMQRFPDSPAKGPPYLLASTNAKINNEWTSKDD